MTLAGGKKPFFMRPARRLLKNSLFSILLECFGRGDGIAA